MEEEARAAVEGGLNVRIEHLDPTDVLTLDEAGRANAHFMTHETFNRLVANMRADGCSTSAGFCARVPGYDKYVVLSGNHRTKAARAVGLKAVPYIVTDDELSEERLLAIQLSHNAINGEDDPALLKQLYESIKDIGEKLYSGLDDKTLALLDSIQVGNIAEAPVKFQTVSLVFLPHELEGIKEAFKEAVALSAADERWLCRLEDYDRYMNAVGDVRNAHDIANVTAALYVILEIFDRHRRDLAEGWYDPESETGAKHRTWTPLSSVLGRDRVPPKSAVVVKKAVDRMVAKGDVKEDEAWRALEVWAVAYLNDEGAS